MKLHRGRNKTDTVALAGWVFADLLLGLAMLFFVFNTVGSVPVPTPTPASPTATPSATATPSLTPTRILTLTHTLTPTATLTPRYTPTPSVTPTPTASPTPLPTVRRGLDSEALEVTLQTDHLALLGQKGAVAQQTERRRLAQLVHTTFERQQGREAGFVLTFGHAPEGRMGNDIAKEINNLLVAELPSIFTNRELMKDYHELGASHKGQVDLNIYFLYWSP